MSSLLLMLILLFDQNEDLFFLINYIFHSLNYSLGPF